ncbi:MAG: ACT domain-containing protein [bacterium]|nr:ACT domain-containing protein [bacterium]
MNEPERDLASLLVSMKPALDPREWVFCRVERGFDAADLDPLLCFRESEGMTLIIERDAAERHGLAYAFPCRHITLRVHSDLQSVGFLAALCGELAKHTLPVNAVSAFYHDHLFVPVDRGEEALHVLEELSAQTARKIL